MLFFPNVPYAVQRFMLEAENEKQHVPQLIVLPSVSHSECVAPCMPGIQLSRSIEHNIFQPHNQNSHGLRSGDLNGETVGNDG